MSLLSDLMQRVAALTERLNQIGENSKTNEELPPMSPFNRSALVRGSISGISKTFSIQTLIDEVANELALGNVPVVFLPVDVNFTTTGQTAEKIRLKLNDNPNYILQQGTLYIPYVQRIVLSNGNGTVITGGGAQYAVVTEYFLLSQRINPDSEGIASIGVGGTTIQPNGIRYFNTVDTRSFEPVDFQLGNIGTNEINDAVDTSGPYSTPHGTTILFFATQDGEERIWLYRGFPQEVGLGKPATTLEDYRLFPSANETDPPPTYQETKPQEASSIGVSYDLFLDNHEGRYIRMASAFFMENFLTRRLRLGGFTRALIDTTGETAYPVVKNKWLVKLTGTTGTATISIDGNDYTFTYAIGMDESAANFITVNGADILANDGLSIIYNSDGFLELDGLAENVVTVTNASGNITGTVKTIPAVLINTPPFYEAVFDMYTLYDGKQINYEFVPRSFIATDGGIPDAPLDGILYGRKDGAWEAITKYPDIDPDTDIYEDFDALIAGQNDQEEGEEYFVTDATDFPTITSGGALVLYLGTIVGDETDYIILSNPGGGIFFTTDESLYLDPSTLELRANVSDFSEKYTYTSGDQEFVLTSTPTKIIFISVNGQLLEDPLTQWSIDVPSKTITILDEMDAGDRVTVHYQYFIEV